MKYIQTKKAPAAIGPYSQAIDTGDMLFCSGQIGLDPTTGVLVDGIEHQVERALKNLEAVIHEAGSDLTKVVKTTLFLVNMADFAKVNEIYSKYFSDHKPARSTVAVAALPKGALFEVEAIVVK